MDELVRQLTLLQQDYRPNNSIRSQLSLKTLVLVVGPSAVGKDYTIDQICRIKEGHGKVRTFITREERPDDDTEQIELLPYNQEALKEIIQDATEGTLVNLAVHPTSGRIYGTRLSSYSRSINYLPMQYSAASALDDAGFAEVKTLGILSEPHEWIARFNKRHTDQDERTKRLQEAMQSLDWLKTNSNHIEFIYNDELHGYKIIENRAKTIGIIDEMKKVAQQLI